VCQGWPAPMAVIDNACVDCPSGSTCSGGVATECVNTNSQPKFIDNNVCLSCLSDHACPWSVDRPKFVKGNECRDCPAVPSPNSKCYKLANPPEENSGMPGQSAAAGGAGDLGGAAEDPGPMGLGKDGLVIVVLGIILFVVVAIVCIAFVVFGSKSNQQQDMAMMMNNMTMMQMNATMQMNGTMNPMGMGGMNGTMPMQGGMGGPPAFNTQRF